MRSRVETPNAARMVPVSVKNMPTAMRASTFSVGGVAGFAAELLAVVESDFLAKSVKSFFAISLSLQQENQVHRDGR
jgi:hypothetical protein